MPNIAVNENLSVNTDTDTAYMPNREENNNGGYLHRFSALLGDLQDAANRALSKTKTSLLTTFSHSRGRYANTDIWNLDQAIINRIMKLIEALSPRLPELASLKQDIDDFITLENAVPPMFFIGDGKLRDALSKCREEIVERFSIAWRTIGRTVFASDTILDGSDRSTTLSSDRLISWKDTGNQLVELLRIVDALERYAANTNGYPYGDYARNESLTWNSDRVDSIEGTDGMPTQFMFARACSDDWKEYRDKKLEDCDVNFIAFVEDIYYVSQVFSDWVAWVSDYGRKETARDAYRAVSGENEEIMSIAYREEFLRCWDWLGDHISELWW